MNVLVRPATAQDATAMSHVLIASIVEICGGDPQAIAEWTANKSTGGISAMLKRANMTMFVAEIDSRISGVAAITGAGLVALNYVAPGARFSGVSKALLTRMEAELVARGVAVGRQEATKTARRFYERAGWVADTAGHGAGGCCAMRKRLAEANP